MEMFKALGAVMFLMTVLLSFPYISHKLVRVKPNKLLNKKN
ncbi:MAG TPA: hypothetical protein VNJ01_11835 [Bacteriovoracaceae bacterium]|nr:hypothetical protein [Bacteriovoracaceae bacterium]